MVMTEKEFLTMMCLVCAAFFCKISQRIYWMHACEMSCENFSTKGMLEFMLMTSKGSLVAFYECHNYKSYAHEK